MTAMQHGRGQRFKWRLYGCEHMYLIYVTCWCCTHSKCTCNDEEQLSVCSIFDIVCVSGFITSQWFSRSECFNKWPMHGDSLSLQHKLNFLAILEKICDLVSLYSCSCQFCRFIFSRSFFLSSSVGFHWCYKGAEEKEDYKKRQTMVGEEYRTIQPLYVHTYFSFLQE